jgi:hypothetical protein
LNKKIVFNIDKEKYKALKRIALETDTTATALFVEGVDYIISTKNIK